MPRLSKTHRFLFDEALISRGAKYFGQGRVVIIDSAGEGVEALVRGSAGAEYSVWVDRKHAAYDLDAVCDCPYFERMGLCKHVWAVLLAIDEQEEHGPSRAKRKSAWQASLAKVVKTTNAGRAGSLNAVLKRKKSEIWYVLDVSSSQLNETPCLHVYQRETKKDGSWGAMREVRPSRLGNEMDLQTLDRKVIAFLEAPDRSGGFNDYALPRRPLMLDSAHLASLSPWLAETGRFAWRLGPSDDFEERRIHWDEAAWRFRLRLDSDKKRGCWRITGELVRGDQSLSLAEPVLVLDGLVLLPDRLAGLDAGSQVGWLSELRQNSEIQIPFKHRSELLASLCELPEMPDLDWPKDLRLRSEVGEPRGRISFKPPRRRYYGQDRNALGASVDFIYGDSLCPCDAINSALFDEDTSKITLRDREREAELLQQLRAQPLLRPYESYFHDDTPFHLQLIHTDLPAVARDLIDKGWLVESEGVRIKRASAFNLSVESGVDWFDLVGSVDFDGQAVPLPALLRAVRDKQNIVQLDDGSQGILPEQWLRRYQRLAELANERGEALRFRSAQALLLDSLLDEQDEVRIDRRFNAYCERLRSFSGVTPRGEPSGFQGQLRDYQKEGLGWLHALRELNLGGCLADDMGLGKTVQVLALLQSRRAAKRKKDEPPRRSIVVAPKSLIFNWREETERFAPRLRVLDYTGSDRKTRLRESGDHDLLLTTYGTLRKDIADLKEIPFDYAILDESQAIKNADSQASKAVRLLSASHRLAMTGTPVENHLGELWSLFEFLNPGMLGGSSHFARLARDRDDDQALPQLAKALRPFLLRRAKSQVLPELPPKTEQTLVCELTGRERKKYDQLREYYRANLSRKVKEVGIKRAKIHVLEALLRLRQAACHPGLLDASQAARGSAKITALREQLSSVIDEGHKALVFSQFTSLLAILRDDLNRDEIRHEYLDGKTRKRGDVVKRFQEDPDCPLFLISLKAGGHGLNLTAAEYVFILDPWWNPAVEAQAIDRSHRIGQHRNVFAYRIIAKDTVEDKILQLQESKRALADAIVSADNSVIRNLTFDDLQLLLS